jgi:hypothetical protein
MLKFGRGLSAHINSQQRQTFIVRVHSQEDLAIIIQALNQHGSQGWVSLMDTESQPTWVQVNTL